MSEWFITQAPITREFRLYKLKIQRLLFSSITAGFKYEENCSCLRNLTLYSENSRFFVKKSSFAFGNVKSNSGLYLMW